MKKSINLDHFRLIASILIVAIHTFPLADISITLDTIFTHIICRIGVPFFLMITGYYILPKSLKEKTKLIDYTKKILKIYLFCILLYIPINIYARYNQNLTIISGIKEIFINGTFYHLWYFPALILGVWITYYLLKRVEVKKVGYIVFLLFIIGLFGDSYYGLTEKLDVTKAIYQGIFKVFNYTRNGLFYVPIFLYLGFIASKKEPQKNSKKNIFFFFFFLICMIIEGLLLKKYHLIRHDSMYFMLIPTMIFLFKIILPYQETRDKMIRDIAMLTYILHPIFIIVIRIVGKVIKLEKLMIDNNFVHYLLVVTTTLLASIILVKIKEKKMKK